MIDNGYLFAKDNKRIFINTSLGCAGQCAYCYLPKMGYSNGSDNYRTISAQTIIEFIEKNKLDINQKTLITLEYNKIISSLVSMACSDGARQTLKALVPMNNIDDINAALDETNDALTRVYQKGSVDFSRIKDIRASLARLKVGSSLNALELLNISMLLECAAHVKNYYETRNIENQGKNRARGRRTRLLTRRR